MTGNRMEENDTLEKFMLDIYRFLDWTPEHIADQTQRWVLLRDELKARAEALLARGEAQL